MSYCATHSPSPRRNSRLAAALLLLVTITVSAPAAWSAQAAEKELVVATKSSPPFAIRQEDERWEGLTIELLRLIAESGGYELSIREMPLEEMLDAVEEGRVDLAASAITMTAERERRVDFSHPYFQSGLAMAVREHQGGWLPIIGRLFSPDFLRVLTGLGLLLLITGLLVWLFERRRNPSDFGGSPAEGIWSGFWWAAVTMTTVGYGDKAPKTVPGRAVALIWMFTSLIVISGFTAAIATVLTVGSLEQGIENLDDLYGKRVGSIRASSSSTFLADLSIRSTDFPTIDEALQTLEQGELDAVVYDEPILRHLITTGEGRGLKVVDRTFRHQYYAIALPPGSPLREELNRLLLEALASDEWRETRFSYLRDQP